MAPMKSTRSAHPASVCSERLTVFPGKKARHPGAGVSSASGASAGTSPATAISSDQVGRAQISSDGSCSAAGM